MYANLCKEGLPRLCKEGIPRMSLGDFLYEDSHISKVNCSCPWETFFTKIQIYICTHIYKYVIYIS